MGYASAGDAALILQSALLSRCHTFLKKQCRIICCRLYKGVAVAELIMSTEF